MQKIIVAAVLVLVLAGCYGLPPATESAVRDAISVDLGHANDTAIPIEARDIALDNHDILWQILYGAEVVDTLPDDVRARMDRRTAAGGSR